MKIYVPAGGMRGAIDYGQPLARAQPRVGKSRFADSEIRCRFGKRAKQSLERPRGFRRAKLFLPSPNQFFLHFPLVLLYFADLDALCSLRC